MPTPPAAAVAEVLPAPRKPAAPRVTPPSGERRRAERRVAVVLEERQAPSLAAGTGLLLELALGRDNHYEAEAALRRRDCRLTVWLCLATCLIYVYDVLLLTGGIPGHTG